MQDDDSSVSLAGRDGGAGGEQFLVEYAVGKNGDIFPEGTGRLVKAGAKIRFNMHYHPIGEAKSDREPDRARLLPEGLHAEVLSTSRRTPATPTTSTCRPASTTSGPKATRA